MVCDLRFFNNGLLGRRAWRLVQYADSLGYGGSYSWSSICNAKALIIDSVLWCIQDGTKVNIQNDPWVVGEEGRFITSPQVDDDVLKVSDLID